jgi:hypothetical protein
MADANALFKIITSSVAAILLFSGFAIIFKQYIQKKYRPSLYLSIVWLGFALEAMFDTMRLGYLAEGEINDFFLSLSYLSLAPAFLAVLALVDSVSRDTIEPKRFAVLVFVLSINSILLFMPHDNSTTSPSYYIVISVGLVMSIASFIMYVRIYAGVPRDLKLAAKINLAGAFIVSFVYVVLNIFEMTIPSTFPPISRIFEATGAMIQAIIFSRYEQLFYVLPFKTQRLIVFNTRNGISIFSHDWSKGNQLIDEDLFSSMLQGMSMIINESIKKGNVQEIKMEQGVLLISHDATHPVASVLIASKSALVLNQGLAVFARKFVAKYEPSLTSNENVEDFKNATDLVRECFPFIPQFD